ncbi:N-acetyltransferase family protein [Rhizobium sp. YIM 134829]|uniref:GNAT family N-acetyltransferase n=1 Tax=Rhizobium sp. YIM 134829 TaxID=3390453 RepID=UPI00397E16F4
MTIRSANFGDMRSCASIVNDWIDGTPRMPRCHDHHDVVRFYENDVFRDGRVLVAQIGTEICGFTSLDDDGTVTALYVDESQRGCGIGKALVDRLKRERADGLKLWTMQANRSAQRFYLREGFSEVRRTDGDNEEGLPDILYGWGPLARVSA